MLHQLIKRLAFRASRNFSTSVRKNFKVTICGAGGGIGQPLSLLMKINPYVTQLCLYDLARVKGVAFELCHVDTCSEVLAFQGPEELPAALKCADVVIVPAGVPRKPGMERDDVFEKNATIIKDIAKCVAHQCPKAMFAIITNPVNTVVPIAAEVLKMCDVYDPKRLFGVTTLDVVRTRSFIGHGTQTDPQDVQVTVIGGHSGATILPVLSQSKPQYKGDIVALTKNIQDAGTAVLKAKGGGGSATLSMAYAAARFANSLMKGLRGDSDIIECSYVESDCADTTFFATPVLLGRNGVDKNFGIPDLNDYEKKLLKAAIPELLKNIKQGVDFAKKC